MENKNTHYVGFWARAWASIIDTILLLLIVCPLLMAVYGRDYYLDAEKTGLIAGPADFMISWIFPAIAVMLFWIYRQATPGKMAVSARIVDAETGNAPTTKQLIVRYLGYYVSLIPLGLGFLWVAFDSRKQGWHDKIAGTIVVKQASREPLNKP